MLRAAGHEVHAPKLTGLGERAHLLTPTTDLDTHVRDVLDLLVVADLRQVVLVGHSYAGMVIAGAADRAPDRIARLVFLDAFVPEDGQSLFDLLHPDRRRIYLDAARDHGDGWLVPPPPATVFGLLDPAAAAWVDARLTAQPLRTFTQPTRLRDPAAARPPRSYVHSTAGPLAPSFAGFAERYRQAPGWSFHEVDSGHDAMLTAPQQLACLIHELAAAPRIPAAGSVR